jgi:hypothetical protein
MNLEEEMARPVRTATASAWRRRYQLGRWARLIQGTRASLAWVRGAVSLASEHRTRRGSSPSADAVCRLWDSQHVSTVRSGLRSTSHRIVVRGQPHQTAPP